MGPTRAASRVTGGCTPTVCQGGEPALLPHTARVGHRRILEVGGKDCNRRIDSDRTTSDAIGMSDVEERFHETWLGMVQPIDGLVVSVPVLVEAQCVQRRMPGVRARLSSTRLRGASREAGSCCSRRPTRCPRPGRSSLGRERHGIRRCCATRCWGCRPARPWGRSWRLRPVRGGSTGRHRASAVGGARRLRGVLPRPMRGVRPRAPRGLFALRAVC